MTGSKDRQSTTVEVEVLQAAAKLVAAFGEHRVTDYFGCFDQSATFIFHNVSRPLRSRAAYEQLWLDWEHHLDFRVLECRSSNQAMDLYGDVAVFTHDVRTRTSTSEGEETLLERETIVFRKSADGKWLAVHEHLSPMANGK